MRVIIIVITAFLLSISAVAAFNQTHNDIIELIANKTNITNVTLLEFFLYLENNQSFNSTFIARNELNVSDYISNSSLERRLNLISHQIELVNSSVDNQIVNLIATFKDAAKNESFMMLLEKFNSSISVYDTTVNERLNSIKNRLNTDYISKDDLYGEYMFNLTNIAYINDQAVLKSAYDASNTDKIFMVILFVVAIIVPWKFRKYPAREGIETKGRMLGVGAERMSIEDMANPEYQKRVREYYNLIVKINKLKLEPTIKEKAFERAREGTLTQENMDEIISGIRIETEISNYDKERDIPNENGKVHERTGKARRKAFK